MGAWSVRAVLAVLLIVSAGCIGGKDETPSSAVNNTTTPQATCFDGCANLAAFNETNITEEGVGGIEHHHDMWEGRERVLMFEEQAMISPGGTTATFRPPQGKMVYEGTASIEFTISDPQRHACEPLITFGDHYYCTDYTGETTPAAPPVQDPQNGPAGLKLRYKHATSKDWIDVGELKWGSALPIKVLDPRQTDMPHATSSVWQFQVVSPNTYDSTLLFKVKVELVRAVGEIPLWPGHPLFYDENRTTRVVVDNEAASACDGAAGTSCALTPDAKPVVPSKLISYGTRALYVWVNVSSISGTNPATAPVAWFLYHRNATGKQNITNPFDLQNYGIEKRELMWVLPVDEDSMDSPYAEASRWEFELGASFRTPEPPTCPPTDAVACRFACYGGCADWAAEYTITIIATSIEPPRSIIHMSCLDPKDYCPPPEEETTTRE
jgi:hypothetical protein